VLWNIISFGVATIPRVNSSIASALLVNGVNNNGAIVGFFSDGENVNGFVDFAPVNETALYVLVLLTTAPTPCLYGNETG
jgi:hypothetical protein